MNDFTGSEARVAARWVAVAKVDDLSPESMKVVRREGLSVLLVTGRDGEIWAVENHCPHEGYPLVQGTLEGCVLTCTWHNWKFDARDGKCQVGGEDVRSFPIRTRAGMVEVDLADPDPAIVRERLLESFRCGILRFENDRAIRDGVRLLQTGMAPEQLLREVALVDARHSEWGTSHGLAVAADCCRYLRRYSGNNAMYAIAPAIDYCGERNQHRPARSIPPAVTDPSEERFREAVEKEDAALAEGLILGAVERGDEAEVIQRWLLGACADHFYDFGHPLIYSIKLLELWEAAGREQLAPLAGSLAYSMVYGTREDSLPYWRPYAERLRAFESELEGLASRQESPEDGNLQELKLAVLDGTAEQAFVALQSALRRGVRVEVIATELVAAAAHRFYRFDRRLERNDQVAENWIWITHRLTVSAAVRHAVSRVTFPNAVRLLVHGLAFLHTGKPMDDPDSRLPPSWSGTNTVGHLLDAIVGRRADEAVARTRALLEAGGDRQELREKIEDLGLADVVVRPIVVVHVIKTTFAAFEEWDAMEGHPDRDHLLFALIRFLASDVQERRVRDQVTTSIRWVADGVIPRKLTQ